MSVRVQDASRVKLDSVADIESGSGVAVPPMCAADCSKAERRSEVYMRFELLKMPADLVLKLTGGSYSSSAA